MLALLLTAVFLCFPKGNLCQSIGNLRLVAADGSVSRFSSSGRLEIFYRDFDSGSTVSSWGTICITGFDAHDADVACRQLGWSYASRVGVVGELGFTPGVDRRLWLGNITCSQFDTVLVDCFFSSVTCNHNMDVAITCTDSVDRVRLISEDLRTTNSLNAGRLEIFINNQWGTVCSTGFNSQRDADTACRQLGFPSGAISYTRAGLLRGFSLASRSVPIWLTSLSCTSLSSSNNLRLCSHPGTNRTASCDHGDDVVLSCLREGSVRLVDSFNSSTVFSGLGRLEVFSGGRWGTVCDDFFSITEATVVCKQLGFSGANSWSNLGSLPSAPTGTEILLDNVDCGLSDSTLLSCNHQQPIGSHNCIHSEDVGIYCSGYSNPLTTTSSPSSTNVGGIVGGVVTVAIILGFVTIPVCICILVGTRRRRRSVHGNITVAAPRSHVVTTTTTTATVAPATTQNHPQQAAPYPASYPTAPQAAPPPHPTHQHHSAVLQDAPPPNYDAATAYPQPSYNNPAQPAVAYAPPAQQPPQEYPAYTAQYPQAPPVNPHFQQQQQQQMLPPSSNLPYAPPAVGYGNPPAAPYYYEEQASAPPAPM